jgi:parallel beta-helix repeat protein
MKKNCFKITILTILIIFGLSIFQSAGTSIKDNIPSIDRTLSFDEIIFYVDDDFNSSTSGWQIDHFDKIDDAISKMEEISQYGGTIYVYKGIYNEGFGVSSYINLIGEDKYSTIIDGTGVGGITLGGCWINFTGFTIKNCRNDDTDAGIRMSMDDEPIFITNNILIDNYIGIRIQDCQQVTISNNIIESCDTYGINIYGIKMFCRDHTVIGNTINDCENHGIYLDNTDNVLLANNNITNSNKAGIYLRYSDNNEMTNNMIINHKQGITLVSSNDNIISENNISSNNYGIYSHSPCYRNKILKNTFTDNYKYAISLESYFINTQISENVVTNNNCGIYLQRSFNNEILENNISSNNRYGLYLNTCFINVVSENSIISNGANGITLYRSRRNRFTYNNISNNRNYGVLLYLSHVNTIKFNTILNNRVNLRLIISYFNVISENIIN